MTIFNIVWKQQKSCFCHQSFLLKSSLQTQKSTFTAKFSPSPSLEVIFFCSYLLPGLSYSLSFWCILALPRFSTSRPHRVLGNSEGFVPNPTNCLQPLRPTTEIPASATSNKPNLQTKYITLLASLSKWHQAATKDEKWL